MSLSVCAQMTENTFVLLKVFPCSFAFLLFVLLWKTDIIIRQKKLVTAAAVKMMMTNWKHVSKLSCHTFLLIVLAFN